MDVCYSAWKPSLFLALYNCKSAEKMTSQSLLNASSTIGKLKEKFVNWGQSTNVNTNLHLKIYDSIFMKKLIII